MITKYWIFIFSTLQPSQLDMINSSLQAFLGINEPAHCYFFVFGLHLFSLGCLHLAQAPGIKFFTSLLDRWDSCCKPKIARILLGTIFSVANITLTALEMYILVGKHFKQLQIYTASCSSTTTTTLTATTTATSTAGTDGWTAMVGLSLCLVWSSPFSWLFPGPCSFFGRPKAAPKPSHSRKPSRLVLEIVLDPPTPNLRSNCKKILTQKNHYFCTKIVASCWSVWSVS